MSKAKQERITRWVNQIEKALDECGANHPEKLDLIRTAATVAEMPPAAFILEMMKRERGLTSKPTVEAECKRRIDESYDDTPARTRNSHEREAVDEYVRAFSSFGIDGLTHAEKVEAVRRFFKFGDRSLSNAKGRAIRHALRMTRNAAA